MRPQPGAASPSRTVAAGSLCLLLTALALAACSSLPSNFDSLPLEQKIAAYEQHYSRNLLAGSLLGTGPDEKARLSIAKHGLAAAQAMLPYVRGERQGLPRVEALNIILRAQNESRGLKGTDVEKVLRDFISGGKGDTYEVATAEITLDAIVSQGAPKQAPAKAK